MLAFVVSLVGGTTACGDKPTDTAGPPAAAPSASAASPASADSPGDRAYCDALGALAMRFIRTAGGDGGSAPDLNVLGAISDCNRGRYDRAIPFLERRLRGVGVTLPPR
ncbi:MAG: hypothetical protein KIS73_01950 [Enhydrobacter sp.]|nr:hypothetical protein [Enhydrobacter sp.]